jgi:hypothetical protein
MTLAGSKSRLDTAVGRLQRSRRFQRWSPAVILYKHNDREVVAEKHFSPTELASAWGVSVETIRSIFRSEPGVLKLGKPGTKFRRGYFTLRIPEQVAERVHRRLSA